MGVLVLVAGVTLLMWGLASLFAGDVAAHGRGRSHPRRAGVALTVAGVAGVAGGLVWLVV